MTPSPLSEAAAAPARYAVFGNPIAHSRSPDIHAAFAAATGQVIEYTRLAAPLDGFTDAIADFAAQGGQGCNVTVPFKFEAYGLGARVTDRARLAGAANTLMRTTEGWLADNTDGAGLMRDLQINAGWPVAGRRVLLIGAGGAAAGVLGPLLGCQPAELVLANRSPDKARALAATHQSWADACGVVLSVCDLTQPGLAFDLVINASASSLGGAAAPVPAEVLGPNSHAVDLMYGPAAQRFLDWAAAHGAKVRDGLGMLVEQAAESFALWRGVRPNTAPVLQALRDQLAAEAVKPDPAKAAP